MLTLRNFPVCVWVLDPSRPSITISHLCLETCAEIRVATALADIFVTKIWQSWHFAITLLNSAIFLKNRAFFFSASITRVCPLHCSWSARHSSKSGSELACGKVMKASAVQTFQCFGILQGIPIHNADDDIGIAPQFFTKKHGRVIKRFQITPDLTGHVAKICVSGMSVAFTTSISSFTYERICGSHLTFGTHSGVLHIDSISYIKEKNTCTMYCSSSIVISSKNIESPQAVLPCGKHPAVGSYSANGASLGNPAWSSTLGPWFKYWVSGKKYPHGAGRWTF